MADRHNSEIYQRRQIHDRINELKINCEQLRQTKDGLVSKLKELNATADRLIAEKDAVYNSQVKTGSFGNELIMHSTPYNNPTDDDLPHDMPQFNSRLATNDLNDFRSKFSSSSPHHCNNEQETATTTTTPIMGQPSDAFKMKISLCLNEVVQKAEEIAELSEKLSKIDATHNEHRKQQKTH